MLFNKFGLYFYYKGTIFSLIFTSFLQSVNFVVAAKDGGCIIGKIVAFQKAAARWPGADQHCCAILTGSFSELGCSKAKLCKPLLSKPFCQLNRPIVQHCLNHDYCSDQCLFSTPILQLSRSGHIHSLTIGLVFVRSVPFWFRSKILCPPLVLFCSKSPAPCFDLRIFDLSLF